MSALNNDVLSRFERWNSTEMKMLGGIEAILALVMLFPALYGFILDEDPMIFLIPFPFLFTIGIVQYLLFGPSTNFRTVNGLIMVGLTWAAMFVIGAIPYLLAGMVPIDAFFESVNGFTTTGSTSVTDVHLWPESLMVWRSMTQWIGGIAVVIIFMYILPMFGMGRTFFSNELEGSGSSQFSMRLRSAAKSFIMVYVLLTVINFVLLILVQASFVDALCLAFTTISTGGLLYTNESVMNMSIWVQVITMVFMFIGGVNFYLHFKAIVGKNPKAYTENKEFLYLITYFVVIATVIFLIYAAPKFGSAGFDLDAILTDYKNALFTVIALGTTTGASCFDFCEYPEIIMFILLIVMLIGASAGSTSGGIKIGRIRIMVRFFSNIFKNILHPNAVYDVKVDGESIDDSRVLSAVSITLLYIMTAFAAVVILLANGLNWTDSLGLAVATISNTGVGFGDFGPTGSFSVLSDGIKIFLMFLMWVGRLEISLALVFLTPTFWSDLFFTVHHRSRSKSIEKRK